MDRSEEEEQIVVKRSQLKSQGWGIGETCLSNIREGRKSKNIYGKAATTALNAPHPLFWPYLCEEDL